MFLESLKHNAFVLELENNISVKKKNLSQRKLCLKGVVVS